jgi:hypothetical protein
MYNKIQDFILDIKKIQVFRHMKWCSWDLHSCEISCHVTGQSVPNTLGQYDSEDLTTIQSGDIWHQTPNNQGHSETYGHPRQVNNLVPLKPIFLKCCWPRTWLANIFKACAQIVDNFWRNYFTCGNLCILVYTFPITPVTSHLHLTDFSRRHEI